MVTFDAAMMAISSGVLFLTLIMVVIRNHDSSIKKETPHSA